MNLLQDRTLILPITIDKSNRFDFINEFLDVKAQLMNLVKFEERMAFIRFCIESPQYTDEKKMIKDFKRYKSKNSMYTEIHRIWRDLTNIRLKVIDWYRLGQTGETITFNLPDDVVEWFNLHSEEFIEWTKDNESVLKKPIFDKIVNHPENNQNG